MIVLGRKGFYTKIPRGERKEVIANLVFSYGKGISFWSSGKRGIAAARKDTRLT